MKKKLYAFSLVLLFLFIACNGSNPLIGNTYKGGDSLYEKEYSITFINGKTCILKGLMKSSSTPINYKLIYKIKNNEDDLFGRKSAELFWAEDNESFGTLYYAKDGSWISIQSGRNHINSERLSKEN